MRAGRKATVNGPREPAQPSLLLYEESDVRLPLRRRSAVLRMLTLDPLSPLGVISGCAGPPAAWQVKP